MTSSPCRSFAAALLLGCVTGGLAQKQVPAKTPAAPLPPQISTGSTVFLSSLCSADQATCTEIYNELYAGLQKQGKYTLVASPSQADLVFEIHYTTRLTDIGGTPTSGATALNTTALQLVSLDRTTRIALWCFTEPETRKVHATDKVLADLQKLLAASQPQAHLTTSSPANAESASGTYQAR